VGPNGSAYLTCNTASEGTNVTGLEPVTAAGGSALPASVAPANGDVATRPCDGAVPWTSDAAQSSLVIDAGERGAVWDRFYERGVAADHANTLLATAWGRNAQNALKKGHDLAGFQYARFHGILNGDIGVYTENAGVPVYDWARFDQVYDAVVTAGMRAVVEIGFTPPPMASDPAASLHWYNNLPANKSTPKDWTKWRDFMAAIVQHLESRYGADEIRDNWFFEIWNESSWMYSLGEAGYPELYDQTVRGLLAGDPLIKVGGPAGSAASSLEQIPTLVNQSRSTGIKLDFLSWHRYGNDGNATNFADANGMLAYFDELNGVIASTGFTGLSINDEWGPSYDANVIRDNEVTASFVAKTVHLMGTESRYPPPFMFGYWTISDLYEEFDTGNNLAYREGNYGLLLKGDPRYPASFDVEKPAFNAFRLLHMLGDVRISSAGGTTADGVNALATVSADNSAVQVLVYNHVNGGAADSATSSLVQLTVNNLPLSGSLSVRHYLVDRSHSNSYRTWVDLGRPPQPSEAQWTQLSESAQLCYYQASATPVGSSWTITYPQNVYGVSLFVLTR
jgi:xylan 1,4-beta-xylosidase